MRYQVIGKSGEVYGTFPTKPLAYQFINSTFLVYKYAYREDSGQKESMITQVLPDIISVVPAKRPRPTKAKVKSYWELLIELTVASAEDTEEIKQLRKKLLKKTSEKIKTAAKGRNNGQELFAKLENGNVISFPTYTQAGSYFNASVTSISARVYEGTIASEGKLKRIFFTSRSDKAWNLKR
ncbi:hypothetical protein ACTQ5J_02090 [Fundicoccus sp. Sow4_F4]|uniref:hypothetical protein n=1 Tax=Fundicoccus sp. Sow4_F4 TaxID=3438783 RepID=UPI003F92954E